MEGVTHEYNGVVELQFCDKRVPLVLALLLSVLAELHHVSSTSYALHSLVLLVEGVIHKRGVVELQFGVQRVPLVFANLLSVLAAPACSLTGPYASFECIGRSPPPCLLYELCPPLTGTASGRRNS